MVRSRWTLAYLYYCQASGPHPACTFQNGAYVHACRVQHAQLLETVQGLERHVSSLFMAWNRDALSGFAAGLSQAVEQNLRAAGWGNEPQQPAAAGVAAGLMPPPASSGSPVMLLHGSHAQPVSAPATPLSCTAGNCLKFAEPEMGTGDPSTGAHIPNMATEPDLAPSTPAGRDVKLSAACPVQPITAQSVIESVQPGKRREAASVGATTSGQSSDSTAVFLAALPVLHHLSGWTARQAAGDPAAALVLASAAATAASDMGLASGAGPVPWPAYLVGTRDSFTHHLYAQSRQVSDGWSVYNTQFCMQLQFRRSFMHVAGSGEGADMHKDGLLLSGRPSP